MRGTVANTEVTSLRTIQRILRESHQQYAGVTKRVQVRRQLIVRDADRVMDNLTGTLLPAPFDKTQLALKTMIGETAKVAQHYASRIAANDPDFAITPPSPKGNITATLDKFAGQQEQLDAELWNANGGREKQWDQGMNMSIAGVGYYLTGVRDVGFGLPDREYYEDEPTTAAMKHLGLTTPWKVKHPRTGQLQYAEHADVWAKRRAEKMKAQSGRSLFTLEALPRDMVHVGRDADGIKWAAIIEEIPGYDCGEGSEIAASMANARGVPATATDAAGKEYHYGIWLDKDGKVVGGIAVGVPPESMGWRSPQSFVKVRFFNRIEQVVLIAPMGGNYDGAQEVFRGPHGAEIMGNPVCPIAEVPMMRMGTNIAGAEFTTPMESVFAYVPLINQCLTVLSNATMVNGVPRFYLKTADGQILRGEDGELVDAAQGIVPGLDPRDFAAFPGEIIQLLIDVKSIHELLQLFFERLRECMPAQATEGISGASAAAWQVRQNIQQAQEGLRQPVVNHASAVKEIVHMWHSWLRKLDMPVYFFATQHGKQGKRSAQGLIEFNPINLTDAFSVEQQLDTPDEQTVRVQQGLELRAQKAITWRDFFEDYLRTPDAREAEIDMYVQEVTDQVINGQAAPPGSLIDVIAKGMQGELHYMLIQNSDNYALSMAEQMAQQANAAAQGAPPQPGQPPGGPQQPPPGMGSPTAGYAQAAGVVQPGMGMAPDLQSQLGSIVPGGMNAPMPAAA